MSENSDTLDAQYFERMPNVCRLCDCEVSDGRSNWLEHIQGKVHYRRKAGQKKRWHEPREEGVRKETMMGWTRRHKA